MTTMTLDQAKDHLADLLAKAAAGEEVVILRDDGSAFTVVPAPASPHEEHSPIDSARGQKRIADNADKTKGEPDSNAPPIERRPRSEMFGILKGKIWIAPDFDEIPEGFEPYLGDDYAKDE